MSSEVCPFCGKLFKRLKSHLPHCKAADHSKTVPNKNHVTLNGKRTSLLSTSKPTPPLLEKITKKSKKLTPAAAASSTATEVRKSKLASSSLATLPQSSPQSTATPLKDDTATASSSLPPSTPSSTGSTLASMPKKKKQKLADQVVTQSSSSPISSSSPLPAPSPSLSKPKKKKGPRAPIEVTMFNEVPERVFEGTKPTSHPLLTSTPTEFITSRALSLTGSQTGPDTDSDKTASVSKAPKSEIRAPRKKSPLKEKAGLLLSITKASSDSQDFQGLGGGNGTRPNSKVNVLEDNDLSDRLRGPGSGHQARVTLQDVKATLGRSNSSNPNGKQGILDQIQITPLQTPDGLKSTPKARGPLTVHLNQTSLSTQNPDEHVAGLPGQPAAARPRATELSTVKTESTGKVKSNPASLLPLQSAPLKSLVSLEGGLNVGSHKVGLLSTSPTITKLMEGGALPSISSSSSPLPHPQPLPLSTLHVGAGTARANESGKMLERSQLGIGKPNMAEQGVLVDRSLGEVRLGELHEWLALKTPSNPREAMRLVQGGWQWYLRKYIHVKKGGIGGVAMLLAGYCVLSYTWCYPHIKRDRWRKYH